MSIDSRIIGGSVAAVMALAGSSVAYFEGLVPYTYADPVGIPTACYGHTGPDVRWGQVFTGDECQQLLTKDMRKALDGVLACVRVPLTEDEAAALVSFTFNVGAGNLCASTLAKQANAGAPATIWCEQMTRWVYATMGGQKVELRGLVKRRAAERDMCLGKEVEL